MFLDRGLVALHDPPDSSPATEMFMFKASFIAVFSKTPGGVQTKYSFNKPELRSRVLVVQ